MQAKCSTASHRYLGCGALKSKSNNNGKADRNCCKKTIRKSDNIISQVTCELVS